MAEVCPASSRHHGTEASERHLLQRATLRETEDKVLDQRPVFLASPGTNAHTDTVVVALAAVFNLDKAFVSGHLLITNSSSLPIFPMETFLCVISSSFPHREHRKVMTKP
jgi:hypothetical protein